MNSYKVSFLIPSITLTQATTYYVDIIKEALENSGYSVETYEKLVDVRNSKIVFVTSSKWFFLVKAINPRAKIITWFQGLGGEEALMTRGSYRDKLIWNVLEGLAVKHSWINIYVSEKMKTYFNKRYSFYEKNYFIMPCFNKILTMSVFDNDQKYTTPNFVYAGGLEKWQCIDETLKTYKLIKEGLPHARLTLLTPHREMALLLIDKYRIKDVTVDFVPLEELDSRLQEFKYGFLIRKDHIVNRVSTPTKMSSYLANGIIPIYTDVIDDFSKFIDSETFIELSHNDSIEQWASDIIAFEQNDNFEIDNFKSNIISIFNSYYSKTSYILRLKELMESLR